MSEILNDISRTFNEYLLLPNLTDERCIPSNVSLKTPLTKFKKGEEPELSANIPFVSAIMQAVSGEKMAIALAREGGCSFIYGSQSIESEAQMVRDVKKCKAGFIDSDSNVKVGTPLRDVIDLVNRTGHSTVMITEDGTSKGKFIGIVTDKDYRITRADLDESIDKFMVPKEKIVFARKGISLEEANDVIWENKVSCLPILDEDDNLEFLVFRKDYEDRKNNTEEYQEMVKLLKEFLRYDDEGNERIYAPSLIAVKNGKILEFDDTRYWDNKKYDSAEEFWQSADLKPMKEKITKMINKVNEKSACTADCD